MSKKWFEWFMIATACFALGASMCSCTKDPIGFDPCVGGDCYVNAYPDPVSQPNAYQDDNGYWHLQYEGSKYFSLVMKYSLTKEMGADNQPQIETTYDTDTWLIAKNGYSFWSSRYNPLGSDYTQNFQTIIADTMVVVSIPPNEIEEMNNMSGQYYRDCYNPGCGLGPVPSVKPNIAHKSKAIFMYWPEQAVSHDTVSVSLYTTFKSREYTSEGLYESVSVETNVNVIL